MALFKLETGTFLQFEMRFWRRPVKTSSFEAVYGLQSGRNHKSVKNAPLKLEKSTGFQFGSGLRDKGFI